MLQTMEKKTQTHIYMHTYIYVHTHIYIHTRIYVHWYNNDVKECGAFSGDEDK